MDTLCQKSSFHSQHYSSYAISSARTLWKRNPFHPGVHMHRNIRLNPKWIVRSEFQSEVAKACRELKKLCTMPSIQLGKARKSAACSAIAGSVLAAALCFYPSVAPAFADSVSISFPVSTIHEVRKVQKTLIETWSIIRETYVDPSFNHQDWDSKLGEAMSEVLPVKTADAAYSKVTEMLATLGDPFTRLVSPQEYQSFKIGTDGSVEGVGLLIASDRNTGHLIVLSLIDGGPAARAGIHSGDELVQIDGETLNGITGEEAAKKLRGHAGTVVKLKLRHMDAPGLTGEDSELRENASGLTREDSDLKEFQLQRETIVLSPVFTAVLPHAAPDGHLNKTGYVKLATFSQNAASDMEKAINGLKNEGAHSYILDLRNNPGGLVRAGLDVAQIWLDGNETLVNTIDRDGDTFPITLINGHALTHDPLVILVNEGSASASEILAGALHDNGRAILVGSKTFGKGKIQSVTELSDGSALFVTVAKYLSPGLHEIDQVGITPDVQCTPEDTSSPKYAPHEPSTESVIEQDLCIVTAEHQLGVF